MVNITRYCLASKKPVKRLLSSLLITHLVASTLLIVSLPLQAGTLLSRVDRQEISSDETLTLTVSLNEQVLFSNPDFTSLEKDFRILSQNRRSGFSNSNGKSESYTQWTLTLSPKSNGRLIVPSFSFEGEVSAALEIKVAKPTVSTSSDSPIFVEAQLENPSVYVQEQSLLTLRLFTSVHLSNFEITPLNIPDTQVIKLSENQYQKQINGIDHIVVETQFALFAESSGELTIPAVGYSGIAQTRRNRRRVALSTEEQILSVKPRPQEATDSTWLPAQAIKLFDNWSKDKPTMTVGEPVTRTITLSAQGLTAAQLPPLGIEPDQSFKVYSDQAQLEDNTSARGMIGHRIESMAIVPSQVGPLTLPEIRVQWWDTINDRMEMAILPSQTFEVHPSGNAPVDPLTETPGTQSVSEGIDTTQIDTQIDTTQKADDDRAIIMALIASNVFLVLLSLGLAILWWRGHQHSSRHKVEDEALSSPPKITLKNIQLAAANNDDAVLRDAIIQWARDYWQDSSIHTLDHIALRADDRDLKGLFQKLDNSLYNKRSDNTDKPDTQALVKHLEKINQKPISHKESKRRELRPLYPE